MRISRKTKREIFAILLILTTLPFMYALVFGSGGFMELRKSQAALHELQQENYRLREEHQAYLRRIEKLKQDPAEIERVARERYNYARPGDVIVNLPETSME
jgi:cell division protein FtsB